VISDGPHGKPTVQLLLGATQYYPQELRRDLHTTCQKCDYLTHAATPLSQFEMMNCVEIIILTLGRHCEKKEKWCVQQSQSCQWKPL
jgi:hypothetical protein